MIKTVTVAQDEIGHGSWKEIAQHIYLDDDGLVIVSDGLAG